MSNTPRTDEKVKVFRLTVGCVELPENHMVNADFARQLERDLAEARAEIESKNRLIEQMRAALKIAAPCVKEIFGYHSKDYVEIKAALAAERGE